MFFFLDSFSENLSFQTLIFRVTLIARMERCSSEPSLAQLTRVDIPKHEEGFLARKNEFILVTSFAQQSKFSIIFIILYFL